MAFSLENQIALITGASRGLGQSIALTLGRAGATIIGTATTEAGAERIEGDLTQAGITGAGMVLDVTDGEQVNAVVATLGRRFGNPSVLVNNAGITRDALFLRMRQEEWDAVVDTNLGSVYRMSKACLRGMIKARYGRIINIASVVGLMGNAGQANYAAAKAGIIGLSKSLAREVGSRGVTVNTVAPGYIATDMTESLAAAQREALLAQMPLGRLGQPQDIATAVLFLAAQESGFITGETLNVNGGLHMY
ncbi:3-oxoacyl-ACP reductase FabG [Nitrococcus mobilis]|uniref:3-oxoacyl-[acyl-carrier-protein] reductase n=1 Tax=Nitrococcus mobilis Nb-231 TaxID=314278 RepID=A4BMM1_9GAMM|nr:3-oxoacyl-ACP reductase FabG [Nitrococcus mobilis]EAR23559.1 3-oxoacyl-(acyl-carrier-protein) reductase [Nitrococcus mobilis Nb-231]